MLKNLQAAFGYFHLEGKVFSSRKDLHSIEPIELYLMHSLLLGRLDSENSLRVYCINPSSNRINPTLKSDPSIENQYNSTKIGNPKTNSVTFS